MTSNRRSSITDIGGRRLSLQAGAFSSPSITTSTTRNPLHLKVNRLLSANLDDASTRAALDTLGEFESSGSTLIDNDLNDNKKGTGGIGAALRRGGLRKEVEGRMAEGSKEFLEAFSEVNDVRSSF